MKAEIRCSCCWPAEAAREQCDRGEAMHRAILAEPDPRDSLDCEGYTLLASIDNFQAIAARMASESPVGRATLEALRSAAQAVEDDLFYDPQREERQA